MIELNTVYRDSVQTSARIALSPAQMRADIDFVVRRLTSMHPQPYWIHSPDVWDRQVAALKARLGDLDLDGFYAGLAEIVALAMDTHTSLIPPPRSLALNATYPLRFRTFEEGLYIRAAAPRYADLAGCRVLFVDYVPAEQILATLARLTPADSHRAQESLAQFYLCVPGLLEALGLVETPGRVWLTVEDIEGEQREVELRNPDPIGFTQAFRSGAPGMITPGGWVDARDVVGGATPMWLSRLNLGASFDRDLDRLPFTYGSADSKRDWFVYLAVQGAVYAQINGPLSDREDSLAGFDERLFRFVGEHEVDRIILDIRHHLGGDNGTKMVESLRSRPKLNQPGRIFVLIGRETGPSGTALAAHLEKETYALFVGEPTGCRPNFFGHAGGARFTLPYSRFVLELSGEARVHTCPEDDRLWIAPDLPVRETFADYAAGNDRALAAALAYEVEAAQEIVWLPPEQRWNRLSQFGAQIIRFPQ